MCWSLGIDVYIHVSNIGLGIDHHADASLRANYDPAADGIAHFETNKFKLAKFLDLDAIHHDVQPI